MWTFEPVQRQCCQSTRERAEFELKFISSQAEKGWIDALATSRNAIVDAWDRLTTDPLRDATPVTQKRLNASEA